MSSAVNAVESVPLDESVGNNKPKDLEAKSNEKVLDDEENVDKKRCCEWTRFGGNDKAQGYAWQGLSSGATVMSQVFLSAAFIYLASVEADCVDEEDEIDNECENRVYGFRPAALVTNISAIAGLVAAIFMPFIGALADYTSHRRTAGWCLAMGIVTIQAVQIGTNSNTWFIMGCLQALALILVEFHYLLSVSYLPDIARYDVDHATMSTFSQGFYTVQFTGQLVYLIVVVAVSIALDLGTIATAQFGQGLATVWSSICYFLCWRIMPSVEPNHKLKDGHSLFAEGWRQNYRTFVQISQQSKTLKWFLIFVCFMEAGTSAIIPVAVTYMSRVLDFNGTEIGIAFVCALVGSVPGAIFGGWLSRKTDPLISLKWNGVSNILITMSGCILITEELSYLGYVWGCLWGFVLCWFYASEQIFYSVILPPGQDSELSGFFVFCTIILVWFPPLVFSIVVESGIEERWGLSSLVVCQALGMVALVGVPKWSEALEGAKRPLVLHIYDDDAVTDEKDATPAEDDANPDDTFQQDTDS